MADRPIRIQRKRTKGWKMPENSVAVCRPGIFGNPFQIGKYRCTGKGADFTQEKIDSNSKAVAFFSEMLSLPGRNYPSDAEIVKALRGKNLACWCLLDQPCHADVLLELANAPLPQERS